MKNRKRVKRHIGKLVLRTFMPNSKYENNHVKHLNGNRKDNRLCNLEYETTEISEVNWLQKINEENKSIENNAETTNNSNESEYFKPIKDTNYEISNFGNVRSIKTGRITAPRKPIVDKSNPKYQLYINGYKQTFALIELLNIAMK